MKILVIGASGMIGSAVFRALSNDNNFDTYGTLRNSRLKTFFSDKVLGNLIIIDDVEESDALSLYIEGLLPDVIINCVGLTKHRPEAQNAISLIALNSLLPHRLAALSKLISARLIHVSTDCVFSGHKGSYVEDDFADAHDAYGKSKFLGEVHCLHAVTLRTSTIGHELQTKYGLLNWFLSQETQCRGFGRAVFSGLPTVVFAQIIKEIVIPHTRLSGLYHVGAKPINKFDLLKLISKLFKKNINIIRDDKLIIDRSLDSTRFQLATGYIAPEWPDLINLMYQYENKD